MKYAVIFALASGSLLAAVACGSGSGSGGIQSGVDAGATSGTGGTSGTGNSGATGGTGNISGTGATGTGGGAGTGGSAGDGGPTGCQTNTDCANDPGGPVCDTSTGVCVICVGASDCPSGQWCDTSTKACAAGCDETSDCSPPTPYCDTGNHACLECGNDTDCPSGKICAAGACADGCSGSQPCPTAGETCCNASCHDLQGDVNNCGACGTTCASPPNAVTVCSSGACGMGACAVGFADCNQNALDGCEWNVTAFGGCVCTPGTAQSCYTGPAGTVNVGSCTAGSQNCDPSGTAYGPCVGQVVPAPEVCANGVDDDCNGTVDDSADIDGDGWTMCNGDCCETLSDCSKPTKVNPGAYEVLNNGVDDDCDVGTTDTNPTDSCSTSQKFTSVNGTDMAQAMDLCQFTTSNPPIAQKKWGVISVTQLHANGATPPAANLTNIQNYQNAVLQNFGTGGIGPKKNSTFAGISTGRMRDANDPGWVLPISGSSYASAIPFSPTPGNPLGLYLSQHGGNLLPGSCGASPCPVGTGANDSALLRLVIRVPTNALSFSYDLRFFSAEYQTYQCTTYNDYYLAMLTTGAAGIPADHNISFDALGKPISVNNGFFQDCGGNGKNCNTCPFGTGALAGTGMDQVNGGATEWLTTDAPIVPGETMTLDLLIFDVQDHIYDSLILLDNFRWSLDPSAVGTHT